MSLRARERRMLAATEQHLHACDPRLAARFAVFARLARDEQMPSAEEIRPPGARLARRLRRAGRWPAVPARAVGRVCARIGLRARVALFVPLALALVAASVLLSTRPAAGNRCPRRPAAAEPGRAHAGTGGCGPPAATAPLASRRDGTGAGGPGAGSGRGAAARVGSVSLARQAPDRWRRR